MIHSPCKECENRGCGSYHDKCEDYQAYIKSLDTVSDTKRKMKNSQYKPFVKKTTAKYRNNRMFSQHKY